MKIKDLRKQMGMSQGEFADYFGISVRNIQEWEQERKQPPPYLVGLMERIIKGENFNNYDTEQKGSRDFKQGE